MRIIEGDVRDVLPTLASDSFDCCVTSPPYFGLRDYGVDGQIGLEPTLDAYLAEMVAVFREVRRVLKPSGTFWLNIGDSYCSTDKWGGGKSGNAGKHSVAEDGEVPSWACRQKKAKIPGIKPKDLMMVPARLALALQADGWWVRSEIVWHKPNPMPESVRDRPTSAHEKIWLLTKSDRYFFDADAVREEDGGRAAGNKNGFKNRQGAADFHAKSGGEGSMGWKVGTGRNIRNVWTITPKPFKEAHFATFPPELAERCIKAGCPAGGHVLDPFGGAGTTGLVADALGRDSTLIELNPVYAAIAWKRVYGDLL